jgi:hypothetical protein
MSIRNKGTWTEICEVPEKHLITVLKHIETAADAIVSATKRGDVYMLHMQGASEEKIGRGEPEAWRRYVHGFVAGLEASQ